MRHLLPLIAALARAERPKPVRRWGWSMPVDRWRWINRRLACGGRFIVLGSVYFRHRKD